MNQISGIIITDYLLFKDALTVFCREDMSIKIECKINTYEQLLNYSNIINIDLLIIGSKHFDQPIIIIDQLKKQNENLKSIFIAMDDTNDTRKHILESKFDGYINTKAGLSDLEKTIKQIMKGEKSFPFIAGDF